MEFKNFTYKAWKGMGFKLSVPENCGKLKFLFDRLVTADGKAGTI